MDLKFGMVSPAVSRQKVVGLLQWPEVEVAWSNFFASAQEITKSPTLNIVTAEKTRAICEKVTKYQECIPARCRAWSVKVKGTKLLVETLPTRL